MDVNIKLEMYRGSYEAQIYNFNWKKKKAISMTLKILFTLDM